jgi:O-antigen/teichoic acid export membrane protein
MPVTQGFDARFSYLEAKADQKGLGYQIHLASQMTYSLVIPISMALLVFSKGFWTVWIEDAHLAEYYVSLMMFLTIGTSMVACTYPVLIALYAKKMFRVVLGVQFMAMLIFIPVLLLLIHLVGTIGAAISWAAYGTCLLISYMLIASLSGKFELPNSIVRPFLVVWVQMLVLGIPAIYILSGVKSIPLTGGIAIGVGLAGVLISVLSAKRLRHYAMEPMVKLVWFMQNISARR